MKASKKKTTSKPAKKPAPAIPMIAGKASAQRIAKQTARIAAKAIAQVDSMSLTDIKKAKAASAKPHKRNAGGMSGLAAAAKVLQESGKPMRALDIVKAAGEKKYWTSPGGKTPHATIYAAMIREISAKRDNARFIKRERGMFAFNGKAK